MSEPTPQAAPDASAVPGPGRRPAPQLAAALEDLVGGNLIAVGVVRNGRIEHANEAFAALFACRTDDLEGRVSLSELAIDADREALAESLRRCEEAGEATSRLEFTGLRRDGGVVVVEMRARAIAAG
ncbi:MAG: PAS domain-containing protein, partial [Betaproteobacteria bacterium]